jgi:PhnB protein
MGPAMTSAPTVLSVMLIVPDAAAAVRWYEEALGATVLWDLGGVAGLAVDGSAFFLHETNPANPRETSPETAGVTSTRIEVFSDDPDALIERAVRAGAPSSHAATEHQVPWGRHRQGGFVDPFGHVWSVGDHSPLNPAP